MGKKILIAGYPRSGNTWLGYMLSYILGAKYTDLDAPDIKPTFQKEILELIEGSLLHKSDYGGVYKTHSLFSFFSGIEGVDLESFDKVIHIIRDPRDVAVSFYFFQYYNWPIATGRPEKVLSQRSWFARKYYWRKTVYRVAREWPLHTMSWRSYEGARMFRYEDLHADCLGVLYRICSYLELQCTLRLIEESMNQFTFDRLSGGRKVSEEYPAAFFRKGITGDFRNHFGRADMLIMRHYAGADMHDLGYEI